MYSMRSTSNTLQSLITTCINDCSLQALTVYLDSDQNTSNAFTGTTISTLFKMLKTNEQHENKELQVQCVLIFMEHFINLNLNPIKWEKMAENVVKLCEIVFVLSLSHSKDDVLIQSNLNVLSYLVEIDVPSIADNLLRFMFENLIKSAQKISLTLKQCLMALAATILSKSTRSTRLEVVPSLINCLENLSNSLVAFGDYETQVSAVEILARCKPFFKGHSSCKLFSDFPGMFEEFNSHMFLNFDPDCRIFLNKMNNFSEEKFVYSVPCLVVSTDSMYLKKPKDPMYKDFWVDFNLISKSITVYHQPEDKQGWELLRIESKFVKRAHATDSKCKGKLGNIFDTVKIELILEPGTNLPNKSTTLKLYPKKIEQFSAMETHAIKAILGDKYKSEVIYEGLPSAKSSPHLDKTYEMLRTNKVAILDTNNTLQFKNIEEQDVNSPDMIDGSLSPQIQKNKTSQLGKEIIIDLTVQNQPVQTQKPLKDENLASCSKQTDVEINESKWSSFIPEASSTTERSANSNPTNSIFNGSRKRRLFSDEYNDKDLILSSQEQLSLEVPAYKLTKRQQNVDRSNISYSNVKEVVHNKTDSIKSSALSFDKVEVNDDKSKLIDVIVAGDDKTSTYSDAVNKKKLLALNKTPEAVKSSNIFKSHSAYSDFSPLMSESFAKKTYLRNKPKRGKKKVKSRALSDSENDDDYVPTKVSSDSDSDVSPKKPLRTVRQRKATVPKSNKIETFVGRLKKDRIDPIRDKPFNEDTFVDLVNCEKTSDSERKFEVPLPVPELTVKNTRKRKETPAVKTKKDLTNNATNKRQRKVKNKKETVESVVVTSKVTDVTTNLKEALSTEPTPLSPPPSNPYQIVNYEPPATNDEDESYLDVTQNKFILQSSYKFNEVVKLGNMCLAEVGNEVRRAQSLYQKEREMNYARCDFKVLSSISSIQSQSEKLITLNNRLVEAKSILDETCLLQKEISIGLQYEAAQLNEARQALLSNMTQVDKTETSTIGKIFQGAGQKMKNLLFSFLGNRNAKKALPNPD